jgi:hypothetical protein
MALAPDPRRLSGAGSPVPGPQERSFSPRVGRFAAPNTISASQARAARRREALSNEQAVATWLRELAARRS